MSYFDLVEILLGLLRASREDNWALHLSSIRQMIPWCFAYDNLNYAKYFPQRVFSFIFHLFHYKCRFTNQLLTICLRLFTKIYIARLTSIKLTISKRIVQPLLCSSYAPIGLILCFYVFVFYVDIYPPTSRRCRT